MNEGRCTTCGEPRPGDCRNAIASTLWAQSHVDAYPDHQVVVEFGHRTDEERLAEMVRLHLSLG